MEFYTFYILVVLVVGATLWVLKTRGDLLKASIAEAETPARRFPRAEAIIERALCGSFVILAVTGLILAGGLTGLLLLLHVFAGAVFAVALAAYVVLRAEASSHLCCCGEGANIGTFIERLSFWALAVTGLCMIVTAVLAMTPLFGTCGQEWLADTHKYVSILALVSGIGCGYFAVVRCRLARAQG